MPEEKNIIISFSEGNVIRNYFNQGLLDELQNAGYQIVFFTPAATVPRFVETYRQRNIEVLPLLHYSPSPREARAERARKKIEQYFPTAGKWFKAREHRFYDSISFYLDHLKRIQPSFLLFTNPMYRNEMPLFMAAKRLGLKNAGLLRSWDNLHMGLKFFPDKLLVWNKVNAEEACRLMGYEKGNIEIIGPCQMDPYFKKENLWTRAQFCQHFQLDPARPIITLATIGRLVQGYDENYIADQLIHLIQEQQIPGNPQLIIRLHPVSRYEEFLRYKDLPFVRISHVAEHIPTLGWTMSPQQVIEVANILQHSNLLVSPGSTITIESAIFDTPTLFPVYHHYQPGLGHYFYNIILKMHHKRLLDLDLVPFIDKQENLLPGILRCMNEPEWYREKRKKLVKDYVHFTDGLSNLRLTRFIDREINLKT